MKKTIGIIGAAGFTGQELIKILTKRSDVKIEVINSRTFAGQKIREIFPEIKTDLIFTNYTDQEILAKNLDVIFCAVGNGRGIEAVQKFLTPQNKTKIIDLSADFRFKNKDLYEQIYGIKNSIKTPAVYGLPEIFAEEIKQAQIIANPGCYVTASLLAVFPLIKKNLINFAIFDGKSGVSGAGARNSNINNFNKLSENLIPYKISDHRHTKEIQQFCDFPISFTPHVVPVMRGMIVTSHLILNKTITTNEILAIFQEFYEQKKYSTVKVQKEIPTMRDTQNTGECVLGGFEIDDQNRLVIISSIDNLGKGASAQAVQNFDLLFNL